MDSLWWVCAERQENWLDWLYKLSNWRPIFAQDEFVDEIVDAVAMSCMCRKSCPLFHWERCVRRQGDSKSPATYKWGRWHKKRNQGPNRRFERFPECLPVYLSIILDLCLIFMDNEVNTGIKITLWDVNPLAKRVSAFIHNLQKHHNFE